MKKTISLAFWLCLWLAEAALAQSDYTALVSGVSQIVSPGVPGPVYPTDSAWAGIAGGDADATFPSTFALARTYGTGRIVALGHDGLVTRLELLDNRRFMVNITTWLDARSRKTMGCTSGHGEWVNQGNLEGLKTEMATRGYSFQSAPFPLTQAALQGLGMLIVGDAWQDFSAAEMEAVRLYVEGGGGLLLLGCGWSWEPYHPGTTIEDFPMTKLARPFGVRWLKPYLLDPVHQLDGSAIFQVFYPEVEAVSLPDAFALINQVHATHPQDLPQFLEASAEDRVRYIHAHQTLQLVTQELPVGNSQRVEVYEFTKTMAANYPQYFRKSPVLDTSAFPHMTRLRERVFRTWIDAVPLDSSVKSGIASGAGLTGRYLEIWNSFGVWLLDNYSLDAAQLDFLNACLGLIPPDLHNLRSISVNDFLGSVTTPIPLNGLELDVNIFGVRINQARENSFPDDVVPGIIPIFCGAAVHEVNHVVDAHSVAANPNGVLSARKAALISAAGSDHLNYLRSMIPDGFFQNAPQEFFASIANSWFTDSEKTLRLGLVRFDHGRPDPINQALFFAEVYSQGGNTSWFYAIGPDGSIARRIVALRRDQDRRINGLRTGSLDYSFQLDASGNVTSWHSAPVLSIAKVDSDIVVSCSSQAANYFLQFKPELFSSNEWASLLQVPVTTNATFWFTNGNAGSRGVFRLMKP